VIDLRLRQALREPQVSTAKIGTFEPRATQPGVGQARPRKVGTSQIGAFQSSIRKVSIHENCVRQVGFGQRSLVEQCPTKLGQAEIDGATLGEAELPFAYRYVEVI
jgi:hypothetical protein